MGYRKFQLISMVLYYCIRRCLHEIKKRIAVFFLSAFMLINLLSLPVSAATLSSEEEIPSSVSLKNSSLTNTALEENTPIQVSFDLSNPVPQEATVTLPNGKTGTLGIEPASPITRGEYPNASGDWKIYWYAVAENMEYWITISNSKITDGWGFSHIFLLYSVTNEGFSFTSKRAEGFVNYSFPGIVSGRFALIAEMNGTTLNTYIT